MLRRLFLRLALCIAAAAQQADITAEKVADSGSEVDEPAVAALSGGGVAVAWIANGERTGRLLLRTRTGAVWSKAEDATVRLGDLYRCALAAGGDDLWIFWSERQ